MLLREFRVFARHGGSVSKRMLRDQDPLSGYFTEFLAECASNRKSRLLLAFRARSAESLAGERGRSKVLASSSVAPFRSTQLSTLMPLKADFARSSLQTQSAWLALTSLRQVTEIVGKALKTGDIVICESAVYPGCAEDDCAPILEKNSRLKFTNTPHLIHCASSSATAPS